MWGLLNVELVPKTEGDLSSARRKKDSILVILVGYLITHIFIAKLGPRSTRVSIPATSDSELGLSFAVLSQNEHAILFDWCHAATAAMSSSKRMKLRRGLTRLPRTSSYGSLTASNNNDLLGY